MPLWTNSTTMTLWASGISSGFRPLTGKPILQLLQALRDVKQRLEEAAPMAVEVLAPIAADTDQPAVVPIKPSVAILARCVA